MFNVKEIQDSAEVIINGFAIKQFDDCIKVFYLENAEGVAVYMDNGTLVDTNMDEETLSKATEYLLKGKKYIQYA